MEQGRAVATAMLVDAIGHLCAERAIAAAVAVCGQALLLAEGDGAAMAGVLDAAAAIADGAGAGDVEALLRLALGLRGRGQAAAALAVYRRLIALCPGHVEALVEAGVLCRGRGERVVALEYFRAAIAQGGEHTWPWVHAGVELRDLGEPEEALAHFDAALARQPDHLPALLEAGLTARQMGAFEPAMGYLQRARACDPSGVDALRHIAITHQMAGQLAEAADAYAAVLAQEPLHVDALVEAGLLARRLGRLDDTLGLFRRAVQADGARVWPRVHLGVELRDRGRFAEALAELQGALAIDPGHLYALVEAGDTARRDGRIDDAVGYFAAAVARHPHELHAQVQLIGALRVAGRLDEAAAAAAAAVAVLGEGQAELEVERLLLAIATDPSAATMRRAREMMLADFDGVHDMIEDRVRGGRLALDFLVEGGHRAMAQARARAPRMLQPEEVAQRILAAAECGEAFSLVRAADGEGAFVSYFGADAAADTEAGVHALFVGNTIWRRAWFGTDIFSAPPQAVAEVREAFISAVRRADVVGLPPVETFGSLVGYVDFHGCTAIHQAVAGLREDGLTAAEIAVHLHSACNLYARLLTGRRFLGLVCCHPRLAESLRAEFGIDEVAFYGIPHAVNQEQVFGYDPRGRSQIRHFPDVYEALRRELRVPYPGAVFLVAAGLLGKIYCDWIRARGGIALDIGAMADAFAGFNPRPSIHWMYQRQPLRALVAG